MVEFEQYKLSKWFFLVIIPVLMIVGLFCWYSQRRRQNPPNRKRKGLISSAPLPKTEHLSPPVKYNRPIKSRSMASSHFTNTDIAYLDKLLRTASNRSLWPQDHPKHKIRRVPSEQTHHKT
ncbi:unnamed protein product [Adineta ricciae]|uniref:Uncharacterized protein n=1 Tax=Adineta ricciae TaxID=249248 RepID=A0A814X4A0_ADIRI|nr:unnamed protein product [Adineta ricciae]